MTQVFKASNLASIALGCLLFVQLSAWSQVSVTRGNTTASVPSGSKASSATTQQAASVASGDKSASPQSMSDFATVGPSLELTVGKSTLMRVATPIERISVGNPNIADITMISPYELYLIGKGYGSTNLVVWRKGVTTAMDVNVNVDAPRMQAKLRELLPEEPGIIVKPAADSVILMGTVSSAPKAKYAEDIANAFVRDVNRNLMLPVTAGDTRVQSGTALSMSNLPPATLATAGARVVNLLQISQGQQVMLEVKVAEISKTLLDKLGARFNAGAGNGGINYNIFSNLLINGAGNLSIRADNGNLITIDAEKKDGLVKVLAEPNIIAISGQEASFLAGGKIFIPVARANSTLGGSTITLDEKEFGVGLKFTPTVLDGGRIHLRVSPEVSELSQTGSPFTTVDGVTSVLPSFTTRRVQTTVQLMDGQSLAIAGLIKNNVSETIKRIPLLGEIPILGALFRSSEFQNDRTELMFLITPRLVKPLTVPVALPTDKFTPPSRAEFFIKGQMEGSPKSKDDGSSSTDTAPSQPAAPSGPAQPAPMPAPSPAPSPAASTSPVSSALPEPAPIAALPTQETATATATLPEPVQEPPMAPTAVPEPQTDTVSATDSPQR